jgi:hypothetical protein
MPITFCGDKNHGLASSATLELSASRDSGIAIFPSAVYKVPLGGHMKKLTWFLALASLWCPSLFAQEKNPVATAIREAEPGRSKNMVAAAEEMPADKYSFKASPDQMSFGHLTLHIADANYVFCSKIGGVSAPELPKLSDTDPKDKLVERVKSSFDFCGTALAKLDDSNLGETLTLFGERKASRAAAILMLAGSWADHYSLQSTYLRLNGQLPPTAKK